MRWQEWHKFKRGVYFVQCNATGYVKIGYSTYIGDRVQALNQQSVRGVSLLFAFSGSKSDEGNLHWRCREWRVHGEWFAPVPGLFKIIAEKRRIFGPDSMRIKSWKGFAGLRQEDDVESASAALTLIECAVEMLAQAGVADTDIRVAVEEIISNCDAPSLEERPTLVSGGQ